VKLLGIDKPVLLAPMGFASGGARVGVGFMVMLSFGDPLPFAEKIRRAGAKLILQVQDLDTAVIFAGEAVNLIDSVLPARDIVRRICG
jgi:hypothetical protein